MLRQFVRVAPRLAQRSVSSVSAPIPESQLTQEERDNFYPKLGNRDIVGFGLNGMPSYIDLPAFPAPAVRFKENTDDVMALREKEKGDWKALTMEEKKALYRASFCQTFSEMKAPTGEWKLIAGIVLCALSATGWMLIWVRKYVYPPMPETICEEHKIGNLKMMIKQNQGPIEGMASKYDYENKKWK